MTLESKKSIVKRIELNDAKSIVKHSFYVRDSITYLDLSTGEYSSFISKNATSNSNSSATFESKVLSTNSRGAIPSLNLDVTSRSSSRIDGKTRAEDLYPFLRERHNSYRVSEYWDLRTLQTFIFLYVKSAKQNMISLNTFSFRVVGPSCWYERENLKLFSFMSILCIERYSSDTVKGVIIALDFPYFYAENDSSEIREYFLYHHCLSTRSCLKETTDFGIDFTSLLMREGFFRFIPCLLKCGFSSRPEEEDDFYYMKNTRTSRRRNRLMEDLNLLNYIHHLKTACLPSEGLLMPKTAYYALAVYWRSIPDALLSQKEIATMTYNGLRLSIEEYQSIYETLVSPYPAEPTPRPLVHYCRIAIRKVMASNSLLPQGINKLGLPATLLPFLRLEC